MLHAQLLMLTTCCLCGQYSEVPSGTGLVTYGQPFPTVHGNSCSSVIFTPNLSWDTRRGHRKMDQFIVQKLSKIIRTICAVVMA